MGLDFRGQVWKRVWEMTIFWSEIGSGFGEPGGSRPQIPRNTPPGQQRSHTRLPRLDRVGPTGGQRVDMENSSRNLRIVGSARPGAVVYRRETPLPGISLLLINGRAWFKFMHYVVTSVLSSFERWIYWQRQWYRSLVEVLAMGPPPQLLVNMGKRTAQERRLQNLCDKQDIRYVCKHFPPYFTFI